MNNFVSFARFTSINPNIAQHGATVEELVRSRGTPDANPVVSPMANPAVTETRLALAAEGSDRLRLASPAQPDVNPYEGPKRTLFLSRNAVSKLRGKIVGDLTDLIRGGTVGSPDVRERMMDSIQRVTGMRDYVHHLNSLTETVVAHAVSAAKP
jgi:hypothetical protein